MDLSDLAHGKAPFLDFWISGFSLPSFLPSSLHDSVTLSAERSKRGEWIGVEKKRKKEKERNSGMGGVVSMNSCKTYSCGTVLHECWCSTARPCDSVFQLDTTMHCDLPCRRAEKHCKFIRYPTLADEARIFPGFSVYDLQCPGNFKSITQGPRTSTVR